MKRYGVKLALTIIGLVLLNLILVSADFFVDYNLDKTTELSLPTIFSNATNFSKTEFSSNDSRINLMILEFIDTLSLSNSLNFSLDPVDIEHVKDYNGKSYVIYPGYIEWTNQNKIIHIEIASGNTDLLNNTILDYYSNLYPSDLDKYAKPSTKKTVNMLTSSIQSTSSCNKCGEGLFNNCDKDECYNLGTSCYLGWASCTGLGDCWCYDGSNLFNGNDDYCKYKGQRKSGCNRNEFDCDFDSECAQGLYCKGPLGGAGDGCCYSYEKWDSTIHSCYICESDSDCSNTQKCQNNACISKTCTDFGQNYGSCTSESQLKKEGSNILQCKDQIFGLGYFLCWEKTGSNGDSDFCYKLKNMGLSCNRNEYDCDWDSECQPGLICDGKTVTTDFNDEGCCYNYENWNNNAKVCNYAIYGTVYNSVLNSNGAFTQTPYSNLKLVIKMSNHEASWLTTNYVETSTDSNGNFYFNPERYISGWNSLAFGVNLFNWKVDNIYAVQGNEVIGEWTNDFNNGFWGGEDSGYQSGSKSRHQMVFIHSNMPYWRMSEFSSTAAVASVKSLAVQSNDKQSSLMSLPINIIQNKKVSSNKIVGTLIIKDEGNYKFKISSSGGVKLLLDNQEVINNWSDPINDTYERIGEINLKSGNHTLSLDYYEYEDNPRLNIDWETPRPIEVNQLYEVFIPSNINQKNYSSSSSGQKLMATAQVESASSAYVDNQDNYQISFIEDPKVYDSSKSYNPSRRPLILVHGMGGTDGYWDNLFPYISNDFDVWQFYYPNDQEIKYSSALMREGVDLIKKNYFSTNVDIVGHSMGGLVLHGYTSNLGQSPNGIKVNYGNNVNKIITLASPLYGSHLANVVSETTSFGFGCSLTEELNRAFGGIRDNSPVYKDLASGSNFTFTLGNKSLNPNIKYYSIAGTDSYLLLNNCREADDNYNDGLVSLSSASLLNKGVDLYTERTTHSGFINKCSDGLGWIFACVPLVNTPSPLQEISNMISSFIKDTVPNSINYQYKLTNLNYGIYNEGGILIKTKDNVTSVLLKSKITNKTYFLYKNQYNPIWYFWGNSGQDGLTISQGKYEALIDGSQIGKELNIYPAQTMLYDLSICTPSCIRPTDLCISLSSNGCGGNCNWNVIKNTQSDKNCDGIVSRTELGISITQWVNGTFSRTELGASIQAWANG